MLQIIYYIVNFNENSIFTTEYIDYINTVTKTTDV